MKKHLPLLFALALLLAACTQTPAEPTTSCAAVLCPTNSNCVDGICIPGDAVRCENPGPKAGGCTEEYAPVRGPDGKEYGNACMACAADVSWYVRARAEIPTEEGFVECTEPRQEACTKEYVPVFGKIVLNVGNTVYRTFGNKCEACAGMKVVGYTPGECPAPEYTTCTDPRPEICTREYNPVCADKDNGIRCITQPCPSEDRKTYATGCTACADKNVYGYTPGACDPEVDNNPADDEPEVVPPAPGNDLAVRQMMICKTADYDRTQMATELGIECVDACPSGHDQYGAQIGLMCIPHAGKAEISLWAQCVNGAQCLPEQRCAQTTHATGGGEISWASEAESFRCVPDHYATFLLHTGGLTAIDENGERTTAIA